jgi:hypothetical protein
MRLRLVRGVGGGVGDSEACSRGKNFGFRESSRLGWLVIA